MAANRVLVLILGPLAFLLLPLQFVSNFLLGVLVWLSFGLLLLPISLIWVVLLAPLLGFSWTCSKVPMLRSPVGFVGLPWAIVAVAYVVLTPSMGEVESRAEKLLLCETWPFSWEFFRFSMGRLDIRSDAASHLREAVTRAVGKDPVRQRTVVRLMNREQLDPGV